MIIIINLDNFMIWRKKTVKKILVEVEIMKMRMLLNFIFNNMSY